MNTISRNPCTLTDVSLVGYPAEGTIDGEKADIVFEQRIAATLPEIPGLADALSAKARIAVLDATIVYERAQFIEIHGDPFGCESDVKNVTNGKFVLPPVLSSAFA